MILNEHSQLNHVFSKTIVNSVHEYNALQR